MSAPRPWQVWWTDLDPTAGFEQAGRRPVIIVSSTFHLTLHQARLLTVLPLTSTYRRNWLHHVAVTRPGGGVGYALTDQIRTIDSSRLLNENPAWALSSSEINAVRDVLARMIAL